MPLPDQPKNRSSQSFNQTRSTVPTMIQKRTSADVTNSTKSKTGIRSVSNATTTKKFSGRQKSSMSHTKKSNATTENHVKIKANHPNVSTESEFGLTKLLAAASAAVAVSPGVIRRGIQEDISKDTNRNDEETEDVMHPNSVQETTSNVDTKNTA